MEDSIDRIQAEDLVLDIGDGIGALIIYTPGELRGAEIEVSPKGLESPRTHTVIHERRIGHRIVFAGVFPELAAGDYRIWTEEARLPSSVTIVSGQVAEVDWR